MTDLDWIASIPKRKLELERLGDVQIALLVWQHDRERVMTAMTKGVAGIANIVFVFCRAMC